MSVKSKILGIFKGADKDEKKMPKVDYLCKIVKCQGKKIGESIAVDEKQLLVINKKEILAIPLGKVVEVSEEEIILDKFNKTKAKKAGKSWKKNEADKLKFDEQGMMISE
ncbi:MAG: hypothetical protein IB616_03945 [Methanosarcinales archaeon]|nr:MAG: hypothetical protein IB616_03945 [Methanosarcinales archaeon]